jgi:hypothetical protein
MQRHGSEAPVAANEEQEQIIACQAISRQNRSFGECICASSEVEWVSP